MDLKSGALNQPQGQGQSSAEVAAMAERLKPLVITVVAKEGQVITIPASDKREIYVNLEPATNLDSVRINLPTNAVQIGQRCFVGTTRQIMSCTLYADGMIVNSPELMLSPGDNAAYVRNKSETWSRVLVS